MRRDMRLLLALYLCANAVPMARAGDLYKCTNTQGQVSIQSEPCPKDWTQAWKRDAMPEQPPSAAQQQALQERREREASEARQLSKMAGTAARISVPEAESEDQEIKPTKPPVIEVVPNDCRRAHQFSDSVREKAFLELSDYQLRRLSEWVAEQCRDSENG